MSPRRVSRQTKPSLSVPEPPVAEEADDEPVIRVCEIVLEGDVLPFRRWLFGLRDVAARTRILMRIDRIITSGNFGDHRERIQNAVSELRIDYGPGYRVYYVRHGNLLVIFLGGGTKDGQQSDIESVVDLWNKVKSDVERYTRDFIP